MKKIIFYILALIFFVFIFIVFLKGLDSKVSYKPNLKLAYINNFETSNLISNEKVIFYDLLNKNEFTLLNVWSSWCIPCRLENNFLIKLSKFQNLNIIGISYKDKKSNAIEFLNEYGNPFDVILSDSEGIISIELGSYGVPETFIINNLTKKIEKKIIGPINQNNFSEILNIIKNEKS